MRKRRPIPEIKANWLLARVVRRGECLVWTGTAANGGKDPQSTIDAQRFYVRRAIWAAMNGGKAPPDDWYIGCSCDEPCCVEPAHVIGRSRSKVHKGRVITLATRAKIAATKRAKSNLPQEKVPEILLSPLNGQMEAERHGISKDMVNQIRAGKARRDYSSPFAMLGGA